MKTSMNQIVKRSGVGGLIGILCVVIALVLPSSGTFAIVRHIVGLIGFVIVPGWILVGRTKRDWLFQLAGGLATSVAVYIALSALFWGLGISLSTPVVILPALLFGIVVCLALKSEPFDEAAEVRSSALATLCLCSAALLASWITHEALPPAPVEPAFSIEAASVSATSSQLTVVVTINRVGTPAPTVLNVTTSTPTKATSNHKTNSITTSTVIVARQTRASFTIALPPHSTGCPTLVRISAPNGAYLTPLIGCR